MAQEDLLKSQIALAYKHAYWTAIGFNDPKKFPQLQDEFPDYFSDDEPDEPEIKTKKKRKKKPEQWEIEKMQMTLWAEAFNRNRKGAGQ